MQRIHETHVMVRKNEEGYICKVCERCTCHRPQALSFMCPQVAATQIQE